MTRLCLDTSAYSHFKRGESVVVELLRSARQVLLPVIVLGELRAGFGLGTRALENEKELARFLASSVVEVLEVDDEAAAIYAELVVDLRRAATPVPTNDIWIAALAVREGANIVTFDEHFLHIRRAGCRLLRSEEESR